MFLVLLLFIGLTFADAPFVNGPIEDKSRSEAVKLEMVESHLLDLVVYPNPCRGDKVIFKGLSGTSIIEIYTINGELVKRVELTSPQWIWDCKNVATGTYIYHVKSGGENGEKKTGKIVKM